MINEKIQDKDEPKPIVPVMRLLHKITGDDELIMRCSRTFDNLGNHFIDNSNIPIS